MCLGSPASQYKRLFIHNKPIGNRILSFRSQTFPTAGESHHCGVIFIGSVILYGQVAERLVMMLIQWFIDKLWNIFNGCHMMMQV
jgi:hypothetical protein